MGQHKYNPNCQLAREGKLPPKPEKMGKRESERLLYHMCLGTILRPMVGAVVKIKKEDERSVPDDKREV